MEPELVLKGDVLKSNAEDLIKKGKEYYKNSDFDNANK